VNPAGKPEQVKSWKARSTQEVERRQTSSWAAEPEWLTSYESPWARTFGFSSIDVITKILHEGCDSPRKPL